MADADYYVLLGVKRDASVAEVTEAFRDLVKLCHPDRYPGDAVAEECFKAISKARRCLCDPVLRREYDLVGTTKSTPTVIKTNLDEYTVTGLIAKGDLAHVYRAATKTGGEVVLKVSRSHTVNDLLTAGATHLQLVRRGMSPDVTKTLVPSLVDHGLVADDKKIMRHVSAMTWRDYFVTLADVAKAYPRGVGGRHVVWMANRLFPAIGSAHSAGVVNGAVLAEHVLVCAKTHEMMLLGWPHSVKVGQKIVAIAPASKPLYPREVLAKQPAETGTDIFMAAQLLLEIGGPDLEPKLRAFLKSCLVGNLKWRPSSAWGLFDSLQALSFELYGPKKFVDLVL